MNPVAGRLKLPIGDRASIARRQAVPREKSDMGAYSSDPHRLKEIHPGVLITQIFRWSGTYRWSRTYKRIDRFD